MGKRYGTFGWEWEIFEGKIGINRERTKWKGKDPELHIISPPTQTSVDYVVQAMSHVSLTDLEIVGLKNQNKNLENVALKKEEERKSWERKCKDLWDKNDNIMKQVTGKSPVGYDYS